MRHALRFHLLPGNITSSLIDLFSLLGNNRSETVKQMFGAVPIFYLLLYEKYTFIPHKYLSAFVQHPIPFFHKSDDGKYAFP
jgi:hypothetical protein